MYKCTNAILLSSDTIILCILSIVRANLISCAANVALPSVSVSYPINALGTFKAANNLSLKYSTSAIPSYCNPGAVSILVDVSFPLTGI